VQRANVNTKETLLIPEEAHWVRSYPPGVTHRLEIPDESIGDFFWRQARIHGDKVAYTSFGVQLTYAEVARHVQAVMGWLQQSKLRPGDRVALMLPNVLAYPVLLFACLSMGLTVVNVNPLYTARELSHQVQDSGARALFVFEPLRMSSSAVGLSWNSITWWWCRCAIC
jgi:long-chain acyl-CoA synthetase